MPKASSVAKEDLLSLYRAVWRRLRLFALLIAGTLFLTVVYTAFAPRKYEATASVLVERLRSLVSDITSDSWVEAIHEQTRALRTLATSGPVLHKVAVQAAQEHENLEEGAAGLGGALGSNDFIVSTEGNLVRLKVTSPDPEWAAALANAWSASLAEEMALRRKMSNSDAEEFLKKQLKKLKQKWLKDQEARRDFYSRTKFDPKEFASHPLRQTLANLHRRLQQTELRIQQLAAESRQLEGAKGRIGEALHIPKVKKDARFSTCLVKLETLRERHARLLEEYLPDAPDVRSVALQIARSEERCRVELLRLGKQTRLELASAKEELASLKERSKETRTRFDNLKRFSMEYSILSFNAKESERYYNEVVRELEKARAAQGINFSNVRPWQAAAVPASPSSPSWTLNLAYGSLLGMLIALSTVFLIDWFDPTIKTLADLERKVDVEVMGVIPLERMALEAEAPCLFSRDHADTALALSFHRLCVALDLNFGKLDADSPLVICVTSALKGEGKSFVASNLAIQFARLGSRTLLLDADLRIGTISRAFGIRGPASGLEGILGGQGWSDESVYKSEVQDLHVLGSPQDSPKGNAVLWTRHSVSVVMEQARKRYQVVLFDTPPVLSVAETELIAAQADLTVFLVRSRVSRPEASRQALKALKGSKVENLAFVMNGLDTVDAYKQYYYA